jgi:hypothetical protein
VEAWNGDACGMRAFWVLGLALVVGCGGESGKVTGGEGATGGSNTPSVGGSSGSAGSGMQVGGGARGGSAGRDAEAGAAGDGVGASAGESSAAGAPSAGHGGSAGEVSGGAGEVSSGGTAGADEGGAGAGGEEPGGPELLWSYAVVASSMNPDLAGVGHIGGTHRLGVLIDADPARTCANLYWVVPEGDSDPRIATPQDLMVLQDCLSYGNTGTWVLEVNDPLFIIDDTHTTNPPPERSAWILTEARLVLVENSWGESDGTHVRAEWELWGYPR